MADKANDNGAAKSRAGSPNAGRFKPLADALAARDEYNDVLRTRIDKACALLDAEQPLYPNTFRKDTHIGDILSAYSALDEEGLAAVGKTFRVAGRMLPHRYPFLLVDRVLELEPGVSIKAYKNVTFNENFFQGHFPGQPIMPGVLIMEALAQAGGIFVVQSLGIDAGEKLFLFAGIQEAKFRRPVIPGDQLMLEAKVLRRKMNIWKMQGIATVDGQVVAEGVFSAAVVDKGQN